MKESKILFYIGCIGSILTLIISFIFFYIYYKTKNDFLNYTSSIFSNIFCGFIILSITALINYFSVRKKTLEKLLINILKISKSFHELPFLFENDYNSKEKVEQVIKKCNKILEINLVEFEEIYSEMNFLIDIKNKFRLSIYENVFRYIHKKINIIKYTLLYIENYKDNDNFFKKQLEKIQNEVFYSECKTYKEDPQNIIWDRKFEKEHIYCTNINITKNEITVVINEVYLNLIEQFDQIQKITYFNNEIKE